MAIGNEEEEDDVEEPWMSPDNIEDNF